MSKKDYVIFGHPFEIIEDDDNGGMNKRSKRQYEEIVTDEKGRQRFHGAFTGGFSAGYFNTVGSKHGWVPTSFTSTKGKRTNFEGQRREDFMDDEDLGEFGIVSSKVKFKSDYDTLSKTTKQSSIMANSLELHLEGILSLRDDINIGVNILKSMGWKYGQGIGEKLSRKNLEKMRVLERQKNGFNLEKVKEFERFAPDFKFAPDDVELPKAEIKKNRHGIGYKGLISSNSIFNDSKKNTKSQIAGSNVLFKGQAFGVGALEGEDDDIYGMPDMSEYDFELVSKKEKTQKFSSNDAEFVKIEDSQQPRKSFYSDKVPYNFDCKHKPLKFDYKLLPKNILTIKDEMTLEEKKIVFAEGKYAATSILENKSKTIECKKEENIQKDYFSNDSMKRYRYNQFFNYIKRGIILPMPVGMSKNEWEKEIDEFKKLLPIEMAKKYDSLKEGVKSLAQYDYMEKMKEMISNKFVKSEDTEKDILKPTVEEKPKKFRKEITRTVQEWHPSHILCKLFNVKDPFPASDIVGLLYNPNNFKYDSKNEWEKIKGNVSNVKSTIKSEEVEESNDLFTNNSTNDFVNEEVMKVKKDILLAIFDNIEKNNIQEEDEIIPETNVDPCTSKSNDSHTDTNVNVYSETKKLYNDKDNISEILKGFEKIKSDKDSVSKKSHKRRKHKDKDEDYKSSKRHRNRHSRSRSREKDKHKKKRKSDRDSKSPDSKRSKKREKKSKKKRRKRSSSSNSLSDDVINRVVNDYLDKLIK
ncbi:G-patch domain and Domain of unknown function DUF1604 domain-containing protein [Strongyloides ratti]|uniref:G-patch domain-containing protein n=1 Tax=Strongyloides ratti TaxID=34506 RepID=A0A090LK36_STRRB|nr:G-patch domain and Domain of unknown function DUF1604 domain-containing protein [Strongyloides ratti]CEF67905.1 G-patch domain and Domain of unknown function DUF1604 domain-containing protein [Strongyloides ratti]